ncbi:MAG: PQQ-binding-like beta-propeller repeat protein [Candidatus Bathyarchaeia archaeon]
MKRSRKILLPTLVLAAVMLLSGFGVVGAHTPPWRIPTYAYLEVFPSPIGKGQSLYVFGFMDKYPPTASGKYGDRWTMELIITKPDNTQEIKTYTSDPVGCIFDRYTPTQTGTYKFQLHFPEQVLEGKNPPPEGWIGFWAFANLFIGDIYLESYSRVVEVTVQETPIPEYTPPPLPVGYWKRPISQENLGWGQIAGSYLGAGMSRNVNYYTKAPETAHIVWTRPITFGGIVGGEYNDLGYYTGLSYESYWGGFMGGPPVILGRLYYNVPTQPRYGFYCIDVRTGEEIWWRNGTGPKQGPAFGFLGMNYPQISFAQLLDYESPNQHGIIAYLWSTWSVMDPETFATTNYWSLYDAWTGNWICTIEGVPSTGAVFGASQTVVDEKGNILIFELGPNNSWLAIWNSTHCIQNNPITANPFLANNWYWLWRPPLGEVIPASTGYIDNVTLNLPPGVSFRGIDWSTKTMLFSTAGAMLGMFMGTPPNFTDCVISLDKNTLGVVKWTKVRTWPAGNLTLSIGPVGDGVYFIWAKETRQWWCYNITNGNLIWGPSASETDLHMYGVSSAIAYGRLYSADSIGGGGTVYCYDIKTGQRLWTYETENLGLEGYWPRCTAVLGFIADKKVYLYTNEHSPGPILWPGGKLRCIDADTGNELWKISFWGNNPVVADGYLIDLNSYDNQIYCFGKGLTKITVEIKNDVVPAGSSVLIKGTVTDQSPAVKDTPCVADEDMSAWMEYLVMQKKMPEKVKGVTVEVWATHESGEVIYVGNATTDPLSDGIFSIVWTPQKEGRYIISVVFGGSKSYYDSYASTALAVTAAPPAAAAAEQLGLTQTLVTALIVIVIICIILVAYNIYVNRKMLKHAAK